MTAAAKISLVVPSRTGQVEPLRRQLARQSFQDWELIIQEHTAPAARARNLAAKRATTPWLVFLDDDVQFGDSRVLERLVGQLMTLNSPSAIGVLCQAPGGGTRFQRWLVRESFAPELPPEDGGILARVDWQAVGTACFGVARDTFERLGGFDERLRSGEDYELCYRLCQQGGRIYVLRLATIYHAPPATLSEAVKKTAWYERGNAQVARKHPESRYRLALRSPWHAAGYLICRTLAFIPLVFLKMSYHHRRPSLAFRPLSAFLSYVGAWVYCWSWFARTSSSPGTGPRSEPAPRRVKILYFITGIHVGGAEKLVLALTTHLDRSRFEPVVCSIVGGDLAPAFEAAGVRVHHLGIRHWWDLRVVSRFLRVLRQERPAILHTHLLHADLLGRALGAWCRVPRIVTTLHMVEAARRRWHYRTLDRWAARWNHALVAVSEEVRQGVAAVEGLDVSRIEVIPNAVEPPAVSLEARALKRSQLGLDETTPLIGMISRLEEPRKGHRILLDALKQLAQRWPQVRCVFVGDGPGRQSLETYARLLGLERRAAFVGTQHDIAAWLSAIDLFALPSLHEGSPMAVIEAMGAGCPIVATAVGGVPASVTDRQTGRLVAPGDASALAAALEDLLRDPAHARRLGQAAKRRFDERFDMRRVIRATELLYDRLLEQRPSTRRLKLLEVTTSLDAGGVTTYLAHLLPRLPREQFEVVLASGPDQFEPDVVTALGVRYHRVALRKPIHPVEDLRACGQLIRLMRRERVDIVHTHMSKADLVAGLAARLAGVRWIVSTAHGPLRLTPEPSLKQSFFDLLERLVYRTLPHRVISVSAATTAELRRKRKVRPDQVVTIHNGIAPRADGESVARACVRDALGVGPEDPVILMVGRLYPPKMPEVLVACMQRLVPQWPTLTCWVVGEGPQRPALEAMIRAGHLERRIRLLGRRADVPQLLAASDVFVLPTYSEGMPYSILEAMAAGLPVVTSRLDGLTELIDDGRTGLLVPPGHLDAYTRAIERLLRHPLLRAAMGRAAQVEVLARCGYERHLEQTCRALAGQPGRPQRRRGETAAPRWEPAAARARRETEMPQLDPDDARVACSISAGS